MQISLYTYSGENERVNKAYYLSNKFVLHGYIKKPTSAMNVVIEIEKTEILPYNYNYMYIDAFKRYYYIDDIKSIANKRWEISAHVDVLYSFMSDICNSSAVISKSETDDDSNMYFDDGSFIMDTRKYLEVKEFPSGLNTNGQYILICAGGS